MTYNICYHAPNHDSHLHQNKSTPYRIQYLYGGKFQLFSNSWNTRYASHLSKYITEFVSQIYTLHRRSFQTMRNAAFKNTQLHTN